jgi:hypothetical protein
MAEHPQEAPQQVPVEPGSAAGEPQPQQQQRHQEGSSIQGMAATPGDLDEEFYMYSFKVSVCAAAWCAGARPSEQHSDPGQQQRPRQQGQHQRVRGGLCKQACSLPAPGWWG